MNEKIDVLIPTLNREITLIPTLVSLSHYPNLWNKILIYNSGKKLSKYFITLLRDIVNIEIYEDGKKNKYEALEYLWNKSKADLNLMLDDDVLLTQDLINDLLRLKQKGYVVGSDVYIPYSKRYFHYLKPNVNFISTNCVLVYRTDLIKDDFNVHYPDAPKHPDNDRVFCNKITNRGIKLNVTRETVIHLTTPWLGSNFDYKKYFKEDNLFWSKK